MSLPYELRDQTKIYLIGDDSNQIIGSKLPSNRQVLKVLFYNLRKVKLIIRQSCCLVLKETIVFWEKARIPTRDFSRCVDKLENLYNDWRNLQKHATRRNENQINKEKQFTEKLDDLFDIAHANALQMINLEDDKRFLILQRQKGRPGYLSGIDYAFMSKVKKKEERLEKLNARRKRHYEQCAATFAKPLCLKLTELKIEEHTLVGNSTRLECKYDLQGEKLYTVKWYKDGNEFYRFLPGESPEVQVFEVTGVHVDEKLSRAESVVLRPLELASSGKYRCEVSAEAPFFQTVTNHSSMLTVAPPDEGPRISGGQDRYKPGDTVNVNCTSGRSKPAVQLAWYINGEQVNSSYLRGPYTEYVGREGLMVTTLGLKFEAGMQHFRSPASGHQQQQQQRNRHDRDMKLKCVATLGTVYWKSKEQSAQAHRPRAPPGLQIPAVDDGGLSPDDQDADSRADPVHASSNTPSIIIAQPLKTNDIAVIVSASLFVVLLR